MAKSKPKEEKKESRPVSRAASAAYSASKKTTITGESKQMRFLDAGITAGVAMGSVLWTATRPTEGQQLGWATFWTLLGGLMAVQGSHELRYGGFGVCASNASYLALRLIKPNLAG